MISFLTALELIGGLAALTGGASVFVDGASGLARRFHIPALLIGLTVVALGTSAPEIGVNVAAAFSGQPALAVGNVLGSNIFNILAVLGSCALLAPLVVRARVVRVDVPIVLASIGLLWFLARDGRISTLESALLVVLLAVYTVLQIRIARRERAGAKARAAELSALGALPPVRPIAIELAGVLGGALLLVLGSDWLVSGASTVARALEIDDRVIGLTVVAVGTSLPELAASLIATVKGERDLAVGNVVGSNIYNVLAVVGLSGLIAQGGIVVETDALALDFPVAFLASLACFPIFIFTGFRIERWEGGVFLGYYALYLLYLVLDATGHPFAGVLAEVVPVVLLASLVLAGALWTRGFRRRRP